MNHGYAVVIPCIAFCILDIVVLFNNRKHMYENKRRKEFELLVIDVCLMQAFSIIGYMDELEIIVVGNLILFVSFVLMFICRALAFLFWFRYLAYVVSDHKTKMPALKILYIMPVVAMSVLYIISYFTHWLFYIDENGGYQRGKFFQIQIVVPFLYIILAVVMAFVQYESEKRTEYKRLIKYSSIFLLSAHFGSFLQVHVYQGGYAQIGISFGLIVMYFELYVYDVMQNHSQLEKVTKLNNRLGVQNRILGEAGLGIWGIKFEQGKAPTMTANDTMLKLLGIKEQLTGEEIYTFWNDRIEPEEIDAVNDSVKRVFEGSFSEITYRWKHPEDGTIYVRSGGTITLKEDNVVILGGYHSVVDKIVREEKLQKKELEEAKKAAESSNIAKTAFLSNMSHDIRTPMNAILGYADLIGMNLADTKKISEYLFKIQQSGKYLLDIIDDILEVARIDSGKETIDECFTDLEDKSNNVMHLLQGEVDRKKLKFSPQMDIKHRYVFADMVKIRQINMNLFSNAIKYTPEGGSISLYFKEEPSPKPGYARYVNVISDTGIGMSEEYIEHIFDSFSRERNTTQSKITGTGLGMSIVKKLVDLMGGTIDVQSSPGKGTTFTVTMDHRIIDEPEKYLEKQLKNENIRIDMKGKRILLVEDNELNAEIAAELMGRTGALITRAIDGVDCIDIIDKADSGYYDVILMDIQMPNLNGYDTTARIRAMDDELKANIPIIAMTADAFEEDRKAAFASGMNGHVAKPIRMDVLMNTLAEVLGIDAI